MNRALQILNFLGVVALALLCARQWRANRALHDLAERLERTRLAQVDQIAERDRTIRNNVADLDELRGRLMLAESQLKDLEKTLNTVTAERNRLATQVAQLTSQRDQLKASLDQWMAAVAARDAAMKQASEQAQKLVADRNTAVVRFNDLANKYNDLVKDRNSGKTGAATRPVETR